MGRLTSRRPPAGPRGRAATLLCGLAAALLPAAPSVAAAGGPPTNTRPIVVTRTTPVPPVPKLVAVRVGRHRGFDRVVFQFDRALPATSESARYGTVAADGRGNPIPLLGRSFLVVVFSGADAHHDDGRPSFAQAGYLTPGMPALRQVASAGDFEATVTFGLGLNGRVGFRMFDLPVPPRVVVDVAHTGTRRPAGLRPSRLPVSCGQPALRARGATCRQALEVAVAYDQAALRSASPGRTPVDVRSFRCTGAGPRPRDGVDVFQVTCRHGASLVHFQWQE
jgi:hypothetical protein